MNISSLHYTSWKLSRIVRNYSDGSIAKGIGQAKFDAAFYYEEGIWLNADSCIPFEQTYKFKTYKNLLEIFFVNDRPFISIDTQLPKNIVIHSCGQDIYTGYIRFLKSNAFCTFWRVNGPSKNYSVKSLFKKVIK